MQVINLYRYARPDGGVTVSPIKPECEYETEYRLIADEGKALTQNGMDLYPCVDTSTAEEWFEVDAPNDEEETGEVSSEIIEKAAAYDILTGVSE